MTSASERWHVQLSGGVKRDLERVPRGIAFAALERCETLASNPYRLGKALRLDYEGKWSTRIGQQYRMLYVIDRDQRRVTVVALALRSNAYRRRG
ncbi:MAG: type II toxin-antitoxin system RelE family toxin [Acidimicrobiales bacterium]